MTGRILTAFLAVLAAVLAAVVVPLGILLTRQQGTDFRDSARSAAHAIAATAEEQLADHGSGGQLAAVLARAATTGDAVLILDTHGTVLAHIGRSMPASALAAARTDRSPPAIPDHVIATTRIGDTDHPAGTLLLVRDTAPLEQRRHRLWLALSAAAAAALVLGTLVGWALGRWITRPLGSLIRAAHGIGHGHTTARADERAGPPQVRDVAAAFNQMADRVSALLETQRRMTADVSHQLRTPLAALRLRIELLTAGAPDEQIGELHTVLAEVNRLSRLVDGLLAIARAEATTPTPMRIDLASVATARVDAWEPVAADRGVTLQLDPARATASLTAGHLDQILDNLIDNALDATPPGGHVSITIRQTSQQASITVSDTGTGMSAEHRAHAFDRYVTDRAGNGGTGLGLTVVNRLVTADHGTIRLYETTGGGITAEVRYPTR